MSPAHLYGGVEAGGTKFKCIVGRSPTEVTQQVRIPTTEPQATLGRVAEFFRPFCTAGQLAAIGVGSFGPCDLDSRSPTFGYITSTPKPGWRDTDLVGSLKAELSVAIAFDTDVNAAALGEHLWGATRNVESSLYLTVGTGIGGGLIVRGRPVHGLHHPEMGHIWIPHDHARDPFKGSCPYHGDCFEGLACGPAIQRRFSRRGEELADDDAFWQLEAEYIGAAVATYILVSSPERIVIGGGIMQRKSLLPRIRRQVQTTLSGYLRHPALGEAIENYLVAPGLGSDSGMFGALALASALVPE